MPPTVAALTGPARVGANGADSVSTNSASLCFGSIPITETSAFPPARSPHCWVYVTLNAEIALSMPGNRVLRELVHSARARVSIDGQWLWWALRRKYPGRPLAKLSGSDLIYILARQCEGHGKRLLLLGSTPEINALSVVRLRSLHPSLCMAGFAPPSFEPGGSGEQEVTSAMVEAIESFRPDYVVLGLGAAKEQRVAAQLAPLLDGRVAGLLCFGGAIDMASGQVRRAPLWMQRSGLEGLYRVWQQPARLLRLLLVLRVLPLLAAGRY